MATMAWDSGYGGIESSIPELGRHSPHGKGAGPNRGGFDRQSGNRRWVKYVPVGYADTHSKTVGYLLWMFGFTGAHRFYYGKTASGILWFFTFGLFGIGWLVDAFLIPAMDREADQRFAPGPTDYTLSWVLLIVGGFLGLHRFVQGRWVTGLVYLMTFGLAGLGVIYDVLTLNQQINDRHLATASY